MKYMTVRKRYHTLDLQLFADGGEGGDGGAAGEEEPGEDDDDPEDDPDEKRFSQKDVDDAIKKRLAREKRKWQREQSKPPRKDPGSEGGGGSEDENETKLKEAESRALKAETRAACFEAGVDKDAIDDVTALAHSYMEADEALDLEEAIEKVVKKYPHFKKSAGSQEDPEDDRRKSWGERQRGSGGRKLSGVEEAFLKKNPGLKID